MADGPFKSMTPDPESRKRDAGWEQPGYRCAGCNAWIYAGDWPFCGGNAQSHKR